MTEKQQNSGTPKFRVGDKVLRVFRDNSKKTLTIQVARIKSVTIVLANGDAGCTYKLRGHEDVLVPEEQLRGLFDDISTEVEKFISFNI